jgi:hypothetical protein
VILLIGRDMSAKKQVKHVVKSVDTDHKLVVKALATRHVDKVLQPKQLRALSVRIKGSGSLDWTSVSTDCKTASVGLLSEELATARSALASVYGKRAVPFRITLSQTFTTTAGVLNGPYPMLISAAPEFATLALLFDEWRPENGHYDFTPQYSAIAVLSGNACALVLAFDPADGAVLNSVREGAELQQHCLYRPVLDVGPTGTVVTTSFRTKGGDSMLRFPYTLRDVGLESIAAAGTVEILNGWRPTKATGATTNALIGYTKIYAECASPLNGVAVAGVWYHNMLLRSRT